jgi:hypothetical protein
MTIAALLLAATPSAAQETTDGWSYSASIAGYFVPDERDYAQPAFTADRGPVHLEARYNYEALKAGSAWLGYAFSTGSRWRLDITPMLGGVFGDLHGIAPGCELTLGWSKLEFYSESEYVVGL